MTFLRARGRVLSALRDRELRIPIFVMINSIVISVGGFAYWLIAAKVTDAEMLGVVTTIISSVTVLATVARLGFDSSMLRVMQDPDPELRQAHVNTAFTLTALIGALLGLAYGVLAPAFTTQLAVLHDLRVVIGVALLTTCLALGSVVDAISTGAAHPGTMLVRNFMGTVFRVGLLFVPLLVASAAGLIWAFVLATALSISSSVLLLRPELRRFRVELNRRTLVGLTSESSANLVASALLLAPLPIASFVALHRHGPGMAAQLFVCWTIGAIAMIAPAAFGRTATMRATSAAWRPPWGKAYAVTGLAVGGAIGVGAYVLMFLGGTYSVNFAEAALSVAPFALAALPALPLQMATGILRARRRYLLLVGLCLGVLTVFATMLLLSPATTAWAGWTWFSTLALSNIALYWWADEQK